MREILKLIIHRGTHQIGGSCIELASGKTRIILDVGLPLGADPEILRKNPKHYRPAVDGLFADDQSGARVNAVFLSHFHPDHSGFVQDVHPSIPVYMSAGSRLVMGAIGTFLSKQTLPADVRVLKTRPRTIIDIDPFQVEPILVDHSAPDSLSFIIRAQGKTLLYTGDFRAHGRKGVLFDALIRRAPKGLDALLIEGTMVGSPRSTALCPSEADLEEQIVQRMNAAASGPTLANFSPTNLDRLISLIRACRRTKTELVIDLFTAYLYEKFAATGWNIPSLKGANVRVLFFRGHQRPLEEAGEKKFLSCAEARKIEFAALNDGTKRIILFRPNHLANYTKRNIFFRRSLLLNSQYEGIYPGQEEIARSFDTHIADCQIEKVQIHTSGHAFEPDLKRFVDAIAPKEVIPIHTFHPERFASLFSGHTVTQLKDGEPYEIAPHRT